MKTTTGQIQSVSQISHRSVTRPVTDPSQSDQSGIYIKTGAFSRHLGLLAVLTSQMRWNAMMDASKRKAFNKLMKDMGMNHSLVCTVHLRIQSLVKRTYLSDASSAIQVRKGK